MRIKWQRLKAWWLEAETQLLMGIIGLMAMSLPLIGEFLEGNSLSQSSDPARVVLFCIGIMLCTAVGATWLRYYTRIRLVLAQVSAMMVLSAINHLVTVF